MNRWLATVVAVAMFALAVGAVMNAQHPLGLPFLLVAPGIVVLVHELGHALAASMAGWRVWVINVFPFAWRRRTRPSVSLCSREIGSDIGGFVLATPKHTNANKLANHLAYVAGGPIASAALAGVCIVLTVLAWPHLFAITPYNREPARLLIFALGMYSAVGAIASAWPLTSKRGTLNDGAIALAMWRARRDPAQASEPLQYVQVLWKYGIAPRSWDDWLHNGVVTLTSDVEQAPYANYWLFMRALDDGDSEKARACLDALTANEPPVRALPFLEAYFAAAFERDTRKAEALLAGVRVTAGDDLAHLRLLTLALVIAADGDSAGAEMKFKELHANLRSEAHYPNAFWRSQVTRAKALAAAI